MFLIEHASLKICTSSVDGYLGCFHVLVIVNSAAMSIGVHVYFRIMVFLGYVLWMDKEDVVHIWGGILLSHEKQWIWVSSSEVDEARALWYRVKQVRKRKTNILSLYTKSRKMVLMNLFAGKEWRRRCRDRTCGQEWEGSVEKAASTYISCVKWIWVGSCCLTQGAQPGTLWWPRGVG